MSIYSVFKSIAFKFDPELMHNMSIYAGSKLPHLADAFAQTRDSNDLCLEVNNLKWSFPVGLAAGFDKNANAIDFFTRLGFGAVEVGTITKRPQIGNPRPRIWRHPEINSVQNAMGFPNQGSKQILENIQKARLSDQVCLGINIGKNKDTSEADTAQEYAYLYETFSSSGDYLVINISSPNTPGLRSFQKKELLTPILESVSEKRNLNPKPLFLKISPDMEDDDIKMICDLSKEYTLSGIIATNTTVQHQFGKGGLSGEFIRELSKKTRNKVCEYLREDSGQNVIGVGGISSYDDIKDFWKHGGSFVQVYTGLIFQGPQLLIDIANDLQTDMKKHGLNSVQELYTYIKEID